MRGTFRSLKRQLPAEFDSPVLVGGAPDKAFAFKRIEPIDSGFVGGDLAPKLHFTNERRLAVLRNVIPDELEYCLLFLGHRALSQSGLRRA